MQLIANNSNKKLWKPRPVQGMMSKYLITTDLVLLVPKMGDSKKSQNVMVPHEDARFHFALFAFLWQLQVPHA